MLFKQGLISEVNSPPHCVNPLSVAEGKKLHLVLDLSEVNRYLVKCNFRFEDLLSLAEVFQEGFCFFTWDLKSGYHQRGHLPPASTISGFLMHGQLPVLHDISVSQYSRSGLAQLAIVLALVKRWRSMSHNGFVYLDDGISGSHDYISLRAAGNIQRNDLASAGFVTNEEKSSWEPVQIGEWIGFLINAIRLMFQISQKKLEKLRSSMELLVNDGHSTYRSLARLAGFIISLS